MVIGSHLIAEYNRALWLLRPENLVAMNNFLIHNSEVFSAEQEEEGDTDFIQEEKFFLEKGVGLLKIEGTLVNKTKGLQTMCGFVSTAMLHEQFVSLVDNPQINKILMYFDSPGGEVTGIFEFAETIKNSTKEVIGFTDNVCCSGAYALAVACDKLVATPSAIIGSIGVYNTIVKKNPDGGTSVTIVQAGKAKTFGNSITPITDEEIKYFQEKVDRIYSLFCDSVSQCLGVSKDVIIETEGKSDMAMYMPYLVKEVINNKMLFLKSYL